MPKDPILSFPDEPRLNLDRQLTELVALSNEVLAVEGRLRALVRAAQSLMTHHDVEGIIELACVEARLLTGARQAHAVLSGDRSYDARVDAIGVLEIPLADRDATLGHIRLTGKQGAPFTAEDEQLVASLAQFAAIAIRHAQLLAHSRAAYQWSCAAAEVTTALLDRAQADPFALVAGLSRDLAVADCAILSLPITWGHPRRTLFLSGASEPSWSENEDPLLTALSEQLGIGNNAVRLDEIEVRALGLTATHVHGPLIAVSLMAGNESLGTLILARLPGALPFPQATLEQAASFTATTGVALGLRQARAAKSALREASRPSKVLRRGSQL